MNLLNTALARAIAVPPRRINEIVLGKRAITADHRPAPRALFRDVGRLLHGPTDRLRADGAQARARGKAQGDTPKGGVRL